MRGEIMHLHRSPTHDFSKQRERALHLVAGMGVEGDAHFGATVKHRSRLSDPTQPNLRQVHLIHAELFADLAADGFDVAPGALGENITTRGLDLPNLPTGTTLRIGDALLALTGLRNPCKQIEQFRRGLLKQVADPAAGRHRAGVMAVVVRDGDIAVGDEILCSVPPGPALPLVRV